jgi:hypothetical protein
MVPPGGRGKDLIRYASVGPWLVPQIKEYAALAMDTCLDVTDVDIKINALPDQYRKNRQSQKRYSPFQEPSQKAMRGGWSWRLRLNFRCHQDDSR